MRVGTRCDRERAGQAGWRRGTGTGAGEWWAVGAGYRVRGGGVPDRTGGAGCVDRCDRGAGGLGTVVGARRRAPRQRRLLVLGLRRSMAPDHLVPTAFDRTPLLGTQSPNKAP